MDRTYKIQLNQVQETLLITLYAKASDYRSKNSILNDAKADEILRLIDYDFGKMKTLGNGNLLVARAGQYDEWLKEFLEANPTAAVVNLGCGLDVRVTRMDPSGEVSWFDVDYPEVIRLRQNFYSAKDGYKMIGSSITDPNWLSQIPKDRSTIVIADGVLEYLTAEEAKVLLNRITGEFQRGQVMFDVMSSYAVRTGRSKANQITGALQKWAVDNSRDVDQLDSKLVRMADLSLFQSTIIRKLPWEFRLVYGGVALIPRYRDMMRLLRYRF